MAGLMVRPTMTDQHRRDEFRGSSGEAVHGSGDREGAIGIQDLFVLGCNPIQVCIPRNVHDKDGFVVNEVSATAFISPAIQQALKCGVFRPCVWEVDQERLLHSVRQIASLLDLSESVVKGPAQRVGPESVAKMVRIALDMAIVLLPESV